MTEHDRRIHPSPFSDWYATQDASRGVWLCDKTSDRKVKVEPPAEWGRHWAWNVTEDGRGIYFERKAKSRLVAKLARFVRKAGLTYEDWR